MRIILFVFFIIALVLPLNAARANGLRVLFLGDQGGHRPAERYPELALPLAERGIELQYTERVEDLHRETLSKFDALILFANIDRIEKPQEEALLAYVAAGGGFVPLHCATYCFRNSPPVVALMGGQFQRHGTGVFRTQISQSDHPIMHGFAGFESWDETYVHHLHNETNRTVLAYRVDDEGREPYTWIRTHGKGRVFYTAWGHDHRTWRNPGFHNLVERGIRWAAGDDLSVVPEYRSDQPFPVPKMTPRRTDVEPLEYVDVGNRIPNYKPETPGAAQGQTLSQMQKPLSPGESIKHLVVPQGFHVELFASEPDLGGKPICMAWDERGRLWVGETTDYPNELQPPGSGHDRIRICEDTDGDGRADKFTLFAEKLSLPTAIAFARGGIIAQVGTQTLFLQDTDGDDVADRQQILFAPWNVDDTHAGVSNFQYGIDNWVWATQGYDHSRPEWKGNKHPGFAAGFFRFRPDGSQLEFIRSTNNNTWGLGITEEGLIFGSTANRNPSVFMPIANRYYERVRGWTASLQLGTIADTHLFKPITDRVRQVDHFGGYTAGAGHAIYTARSYPQPYWNRTALVCGPTGHLVGTFVLKPDGGNYRSTNPCNLLASDDEWTAPIMAEVGPDGSVWVIDWYNFIVQHNPTPQGFETGAGNAYVSELRDKTHGRIYRVVYDGATDKPRKSLAGAAPFELVAALNDSNFLWRRHAQRLLVERGDRDVADALVKLVQDQRVDTVGLNVGAIHALWTLHGLGLLDGNHPQASAAARAALQHPASGVRLNALRVLPKDRESVDAVLRTGVLREAHAQVRLAALLALADLPAAPLAAAELVEQFAAAADDRFMTDAAIAAAANNDVAFLPAALANQREHPTLVEAIEVVAQHFARGEQREAVAPLIAAMNTAKPRFASAIIAGLVRGWPAGVTPELTPESEAQLEALAERLDSSGRGPLIKLSGAWGSQRLAKYADRLRIQLLARLDDTTASDNDRLAAADQIVDLASDDLSTVLQLLERITPQTPPQLATGIINSLGASTAEGAGGALVGKVSSLAPGARRSAITVLLGRQISTKALLAGIDEGAVLVTELTVEQRRSLTEHSNTQIRTRAVTLLEQRGVLPSADRQIVLDQLMPIVQSSGNAALGRQVYKKNCANCHVHTGEGTRIGPDLTGMSIHPKGELLTQIIDPSRSVEGNFRLYNVATVAGRTLAGMLAAESQTSIELVDAQGKKITVLREDIEELVASPKSMMPDGFEKQIPSEQLRDLLEFLTQRGKFVPLDLRQVATISSARGMFDNKRAPEQRLIFSDWTPKSFQGVPFEIIDPGEGDLANVILLQGPYGSITKKMPRQARVAVNGPAKAIHLLSGVSGWGYAGGVAKESLTMTVRLIYNDGVEEDHPLYDGIHFADYIRRVDVPKSQFAFALRGQQIRYLAIHPQRCVGIRDVEFIKGDDNSAPVVMAVTVETSGSD